VLARFDDRDFNGTKLDIQVPERFRSDLSQKDIQRRLSGNKHGLQGPPQGGPMPAGQIPSGPRASFSRNNSMRKFRANSLAYSDGSGRRNSIFSPQDARSDLPELPEIPEIAKVPEYAPVEKSPDGSQIREGTKAQDGPKNATPKNKGKKKKGAEAQTADTTPSGREEGSTTAPSELR
jgi:hypothetical protein